jgi:hypothetical protein
MFNRHLLIVAGMALATGAAFAQGPYADQPRYVEPQHDGDWQRDDRDSHHSLATWREQQRTAEQDQRIRDGQANGSITPREASWLLEQQRQIRRAEWRASRDGVLTRDERHQIRYMQDRVDRSIDRLETNRHAY